MSTKLIELIRVKNGIGRRQRDVVAEEVLFSVILNGKNIATLLATPDNLKYLAVGFLASEGLLDKKEDIISIEDADEGIKIKARVKNEIESQAEIITSGCGKGKLLYEIKTDKKISANISIPTTSISYLLRKFQHTSELFKTTGGVHSVALCDTKGIVCFKEDIGRHNALDKIIGECILSGISLDDKFILTSGRITYEIVVKSVRAGIPIVISRSSPTDLAIELAKKTNITLVGFARGNKMNIYTHPERIKVNISGKTKSIIDRIKALKEKKQAIILAHNYQIGEIQDIADFVGDSLDLSRKAAQTNAKIIVFCGVHFMAETASILSPDKKVLIPDVNAGCPLADMITVEELLELKKKHPQAIVVSYVNTTAEIKAETDICCTSSNGIKVIESIPKDKEIIFNPDEYLGDYIAKKTNRKLILWDGFCPTHRRILAKDIQRLKAEHPEAKVVVHPECTTDVVELADAAFGTMGICRYVKESSAKEFIIGTENGIIHRLKKENPDKTFYPASELAVCPNMKLITLEKVLWALEDEVHHIQVPEDIAKRAKKAIDRMLTVI
jgi:quinolinate synthase